MQDLADSVLCLVSGEPPSSHTSSDRSGTLCRVPLPVRLPAAERLENIAEVSFCHCPSAAVITLCAAQARETRRELDRSSAGGEQARATHAQSVARSAAPVRCSKRSEPRRRRGRHDGPESPASQRTEPTHCCRGGTGAKASSGHCGGRAGGDEQYWWDWGRPPVDVGTCEWRPACAPGRRHCQGPERGRDLHPDKHVS